MRRGREIRTKAGAITTQREFGGLGARGRAEAVDADASEFEGAMASMGAVQSPVADPVSEDSISTRERHRARQYILRWCQWECVHRPHGCIRLRRHRAAIPGRTDARRRRDTRPHGHDREPGAGAGEASEDPEAVAAAAVSGDASTRVAGRLLRWPHGCAGRPRMRRTTRENQCCNGEHRCESVARPVNPI